MNDAQPSWNVWNHLLYYENGSSVEHVLVNGLRVVGDGRDLMFDGDAILAEGEELVAKTQRNASQNEIANQYPAYRDMVVEALRGADMIECLAKLN